MSTLVDQARMRAEDFRYGAVEFSASQATGIFHLLRQLADRVQELEGKGEPVAWMRDDKEDCITAKKKRDMADHNGLPGKRVAESYGIPLFASQPSIVQPEKEERRPLSDEQIDAAFDASDGTRVGVARAIDRAHRISPSPSMVGREGEA